MNPLIRYYIIFSLLSVTMITIFHVANNYHSIPEFNLYFSIVIIALNITLIIYNIKNIK